MGSAGSSDRLLEVLMMCVGMGARCARSPAGTSQPIRWAARSRARTHTLPGWCWSRDSFKLKYHNLVFKRKQEEKKPALEILLLSRCGKNVFYCTWFIQSVFFFLFFLLLLFQRQRIKCVKKRKGKKAASGDKSTEYSSRTPQLSTLLCFSRLTALVSWHLLLILHSRWGEFQHFLWVVAQKKGVGRRGEMTSHCLHKKKTQHQQMTVYNKIQASRKKADHLPITTHNPT